jgi:hypothetical protein
MRSPEATKRAAKAFFQRHKNDPVFREKRRLWTKKWRHANPDHYATPRYRYVVLRSKCKHRGIQMVLSFEEYCELVVDKPCHYCGSMVVQMGSGLDRVDNDYGYSAENCVPCCYHCNVMKSNQTLEDFYERIERILYYRDRRKA